MSIGISMIVSTERCKRKADYSWGSRASSAGIGQQLLDVPLFFGLNDDMRAHIKLSHFIHFRCCTFGIDGSREHNAARRDGGCHFRKVGVIQQARHEVRESMV